VGLNPIFFNKRIRRNMSSINDRIAPVEMSPDEFRAAGYQIIDQIADFLTSLPDRPVNPGESPRTVRQMLGNNSLPEKGMTADNLLAQTADLLFDHSAFNGHPKFWGYITSSATPIGALGDLLAAAVNPNVGAWGLSPMASEIEAQTIRWIAELVGFPQGSGGILTSGGNMANFIGFLAARRAKADWDIRQEGVSGTNCPRLRVYASEETHTWVQKAADLFGLGTNAIRWISTNSRQEMNTVALQAQIEADLAGGEFPFLVVGAAGTVSTGAVDPLPEIADICREFNLWFHIDGAYGAFAAG
jgi:glutamate/tyrosine decarboxylase-like PLP-dependent enzyme